MSSVDDATVEELIRETAKLRMALANTRSPSKAALIGQGGRSVSESSGGEWIRAVFMANSRDAREQSEGKAALEAMGSVFMEPDAKALDGTMPRGGWTVPGEKATLGTTGPTGLYISPNAVVEDLVTIAAASNIYRNLLDVTSGVATPSVAIPEEGAIPSRALIAPWGQTKQNVDIAYNQYTATFYTLAKIHDVANQLLRYSAGAAEKNVIGRLGRAFGLGEAYYILNGSGTAEPYGLLTALTANGTFTTNKGAATSTFATSIIGTIVSGLSTFEARALRADAVVLHPTNFWKMVAEADSTGRPYVASFLGGATGAIDGSGPLSIFGVPVYRDPLMTLNSGLVGNFKSGTLYTGEGYRVDTSSEAGTRWDQNLTGFRGEEEIAFNAQPYCEAGKFQMLTGLQT